MASSGAFTSTESLPVLLPVVADCFDELLAVSTAATLEDERMTLALPNAARRNKCPAEVAQKRKLIILIFFRNQCGITAARAARMVRQKVYITFFVCFYSEFTTRNSNSRSYFYNLTYYDCSIVKMSCPGHIVISILI